VVHIIVQKQTKTHKRQFAKTPTMNFAAPQDPARELYKIYQRFCAFGKGHRVAAQQLAMDSRTFQKFCRDAGVISKRLTKTSVDLVFTKVKSRGQRTIDFNGFLECLRHVSAARQVTFDALVTYILKSGVGPTTNSATQAEAVRFHDDTNSYTGVHKAGGPTTLGNGGDGAVITLSNLTDRSDYDIRGRKIVKASPQRGRGGAARASPGKQRRLSAKGQEMLNSAMGAYPVDMQQQQQQQMPSYAQPQQRQQQRQAPQRQAPQRQAPQGQAPQGRQQQRASPQKSGGNIFDRLTDSSQYTGAHKHRFDQHGRGRGLEGRDRIATGRGHVAANSGVGVGGRQYTGSTNTKSDQVFHDSSQFLMRR
jgi:hypothetical protein